MRERFHELTAETRSFGERMRLLLPPALLLVFTLCVFAPYEYVLTNYQEFWFSFGQIWWCFPLLAICLLAVILLVGVLLRGKLADLYLTLLFALAIAFYIEGNFLPAEYGVQTGAKIQWERYGAYTFFDTGVWCVLCILPFILYWLSARLWRSVLRALSVGILLVQAVTLVTVVAINPDCLHNSAQGIGFSWEGTGELSKNENTLFILVDECDVAYINEQRAHDPHCTDFLEGFTFYPDTVGVYNITFPAVTQYLTGKMWYMDTTVTDYCAQAWQQDELFTGMKTRGYDVRILGSQKDFGAPRADIIDNCTLEDARIRSYPGLVRTLMQLVSFRYFPHGFKPGLWTPTDDVALYLDAGDLYREQDDILYRNLCEHPIQAGREEPAFRYLHLNAMHLPFRLNGNVEPIGDNEANSYQQGQAVLRILETILTQLKQQGIYDNSAIVIAADHGLREDRFTEITQPHNPTLMVKPRNSTGPFTVSAQPMWTTNMKATLMDAAGLPNWSDFGESMLRPEQCEWCIRYFYPVVTANSQNELVEYEVLGEATYLNVWEKTGRVWPLGTEYFDD